MNFRPGNSAAVILAAGLSLRMGRPKPLLNLRGKTYLETILQLYRPHGIPTCIVLGESEHEIRSRLDLQGSKTILNPAPERGPLSSLQIALTHIDMTAACFLHAVDHPLVSPGTVAALLRERQRHPLAILIPTFHSRGGHPVVFPQRFYRDLMTAPLEVGARWVVRQRSDSVIQVPVPDEGILANLNSPSDLQRWGVD